MVERSRADQRHPQESVSVPHAEKQSVKNPRPPGAPNYIGPLIAVTSAAASAGAASLTVETSARFLAGDKIRIELSTGDYMQTTVSGVDDATTISFIHPLPESVASGALVLNKTANAEASF